MWGMYDKFGKPTEKEQIMSGVIPANVKYRELHENDWFLQARLGRRDFPFRKFNGDEQVYFGWYLLVPEDMNIISFVENGGVNLDKDMFKVKDMKIRKGLVNYDVYTSFGIGKISDNWSLMVTIEKK